MSHEAMPPTVFLVDDDPQVTKALARLLREHGLPTAEFATAEDFMSRLPLGVPGCLVLDIALPGIDGLSLQRHLAEQGQSWPVVFLTGNGDIPLSVKAMKAGAVDFLTKPVPALTLVAAVTSALERDAEARRILHLQSELSRRHASLTRRERQVLECLAQGKRNKQIAAELGIVEPTVKFHRARIMERMCARNLAELMHMAARLALPVATVQTSRLDAPGDADYPKG